MKLSYDEHKALDENLIKTGVVEVGGFKVLQGGKAVTTDANEDNLGNLRQMLVKSSRVSFAETKKLIYPQPKETASLTNPDTAKNTPGPQNNK